MQSMLNIYGLPLCLSGINHPLALSHEIADHDHRRQAMRKKRSVRRGREGIFANQEMGARQYFVEVKDEEDLNDILYDLSHKLTATAA